MASIYNPQRYQTDETREGRYRDRDENSSYSDQNSTNQQRNFSSVDENIGYSHDNLRSRPYQQEPWRQTVGADRQRGWNDNNYYDRPVSYGRYNASNYGDYRDRDRYVDHGRYADRYDRYADNNWNGERYPTYNRGGFGSSGTSYYSADHNNGNFFRNEHGIGAPYSNNYNNSGRFSGYYGSARDFDDNRYGYESGRGNNQFEYGLLGNQYNHNRHEQHFDPDYLQWRAEQLSNLDNDYHSWRKDRYQKFSDDFNQWRTTNQSRNQTTGKAGSNKPTGTSITGESSHHNGGNANLAESTSHNGTKVK